MENTTICTQVKHWCAITIENATICTWNTPVWHHNYRKHYYLSLLGWLGVKHQVSLSLSWICTTSVSQMPLYSIGMRPSSVSPSTTIRVRHTVKSKWFTKPVQDKLSAIKQKLDFFFTHIISNMNCFKCLGCLYLCAREATVLSPQTCRIILNVNS